MKNYIGALLVIIVDQIVKYIIRTNMYIGQSINLLGNFFRLTYIENSGAAFSMLSGQRVFLIAAPIIAIILAIAYLHKNKPDHWTLMLAVELIIAGGAGNLIDRILFGSVTDMFDFSIFPPIFNVADIAVTLGCFLLIIYILFGDKYKHEQ